ncbi:MAG: YIP1 family protein [Gammaproteobacteria bacterium]|nr:YIP1 family protein [Gammaproteobacteria bacterium]
MGSRSKLDNVLQDVIKVITNPVGFYRNMPKTGGFADPVIFVLVMAVTMGFLIAVFSLFGAGVIGAMAAGFSALIFMPIFALVGSFIGAAILFVIWKLMGSGESYETAYRCVAYAAAIYPIMAVLGLIPYIGTLIGIAWGMYLMISASIEVHQLNQKTAYTVFGILGALLIVMNLGSEMATRKMTAKVEGLEKQFEGITKQLEQSADKTPEQMGKDIGDFIKGLGNATKNTRDNVDDDNTDGTSPETLSSDNTVSDGINNASPQLSPDNAASGDTMTSEQAGKALGDFFKGLSEATKDLQQQEVPTTDTTPADISSSEAADGANQGR